jgi:hypothetical protein
MRQELRGMTAGLVCGLALAAVAANAQTKVWSIHLETVGWQDPYVEMDARFKTPAPAKSGTRPAQPRDATGVGSSAVPMDLDLGVIWPDELVLDASGQVIVGFAAKRAGPTAPKALRVVTLNGKDGSMVRQMDLPAATWDRTAVMLAGDGALLVVAGDRVQRVKSDGTIGISIPIPPQPEINPGLWVRQSPSGRTLMMTTDEKSFRFVRTDTLAAVAECRLENDEIHTLTDDLAVSMAENKTNGFELHYGPLCGPMKMLWNLADSRSSSVHLLEDGSVLEVGQGEVRQLTVSDKTVWSWKPSGDAHPSDLDGFSASRNGERMALELTAYRTLHSPSCMECKGPSYESWGEGIAVLDAKSGELAATVPLDHAKQNRLAFALSPDGRKLAVMHDGVLELWAL